MSYALRACFLLAVLAPSLAAAVAPADRNASRVKVAFVTDEADAVLAILARRRAGEAVTEADWARLLGSEGYVRLKKREATMKRPFTDEEFRAFVLSDALLAKGPALAETLARWTSADISVRANRIMPWLPAAARISAKVYPVIKPKENSFVFELASDPAVFLWLDPGRSREDVENTIAHELHHVGQGTACPTEAAKAAIAGLPGGRGAALNWIAAFGEGLAMLAAAGGPRVHPHATSRADDRERWDRDMARAAEDQKAVERFLLEVTAGLPEDAAWERGFSFFGVQGPWYTVGWKMAFQIETALGRDRVVDAFCDPRLLFPTANEAGEKLRREGKEALPPWSTELVTTLSGPPAPAP